ncbi:Hpt domain-containing protein, partial [Xanthomonas sacchari]
MSAVPDDIAADFIIEAQEILDRLGEQLVSLEQAPEDSGQLNAVFRGFHTLKGGAGFLAINAMVELCHAAEETLGMARAGQATLQARHFDAAQQSLDYLQSMLDAFGSGQEPPRAPPELIAQFDAHGDDAPAPAPAKSAAPAPAAVPATAAAAGDLISDDEFEALLDQLHGDAPPTATPQALQPAP